MTFESELLAMGDGVLLSFAGESLTYFGSQVTATVNRDSNQILKRYPQFSEKTECVVWLRTDDIDGAPVAGEYFVDVDGNQYRILEIDFDGLGWACACAMERV